jgi:tonB family C-terminal domain
MKRFNHTLVLIGLALTTLLFFSSMKKIEDIKDNLDEGEQVENGVVSDDSLAHVSEREKTTPEVKSTTKTGEITAESSAPKKVFKGKVYDLVDEMPSFPGGPAELMKWLSSHVQYPAIESCIQGRVIVAFIVEPDGSISNAKLVRSLDPSIDQEALRVVRQMPKWIPGKQNGVAVRVKYNVPVIFKLQ